MPSKTVCNQTSLNMKRGVERELKEQYGVQGSGFFGENHA